MKLVDKYTRAIDGRASWIQQYGTRPDLKLTTEALESLGSNPSPEDVERVSGNRISCDVPACDECTENWEQVICFNENSDDWESRPTYLCARCLLRAMEMIEP